MPSTRSGYRCGTCSRRLAPQKSPAEIDRIRRAGRLTVLSFPAGWEDCPGLQIATEQYLPSLRPASYATLKPGHTFHVRAMARHVGFAGVGVSETVTVTEDGAEVLTSNTRELAIVE